MLCWGVFYVKVFTICKWVLIHDGHSLHSKEASGLNLCKQCLLHVQNSVDVQQHVLLNGQIFSP
jgi:hypothetical protein